MPVADSLYYLEMIPSRRARSFPARNSLAARKEALTALGTPIFDLSESNPTRTGLGISSRMLREALAEPGSERYSPDPRGLRSAREAVCRRLSEEGRRVKEDDLFLCASTSEAYSYLFKLLCDPGEAVLVPRPGYPLFEQLAAIESVEAIGYPLEYERGIGWAIDLQWLKDRLARGDAARVKAMVLIHPNNPTGSYVASSERNRIIELCAAHDIALIADEVFLNFELNPRETPRSFLGEDAVPVFCLDGFSKRLCLPQVKLGWVALSGPKDRMSTLSSSLEIISDSFLSAGTPVMNAAASLLSHSDDVLRNVRVRMRQVMDVYEELLLGPDSPHEILRCEGGWTALVRSPGLSGEEDLAAGLLEEGFWAHPGYFFDIDRGTHFALSLIVRPEEARTGAEAYRNFFDRLTDR